MKELRRFSAFAEDFSFFFFFSFFFIVINI